MRNPARTPASLEQRLALRNAFLRRLPMREVLRTFDDVPGVFYILKDAQSRVMAISPESVKRMGYRHEDEVIGRPPHEYLPKELADKFRTDDGWVLTHGEPRLNMVEMWFNPQGRRDWIVTSKYPLRDTRGRVVGVIGILQNLKVRQRRLADLGPVGKAVDYIGAHLGETLMVPEIARRAGLSERQLQRLFARVLAQTIQQYIIATRIHAASHELIHSERSIAEIALMFGFNDQSAFSNSFRALTGLSPRAYRQRSARETT
jgi:PAS domain S-box-containing protein